MGPIPGTIALFGAFLIMIILLAVLAMIVVKALADSPWGMFNVIATIPIAVFMGVYMRYLRPGRIGEVSIIGVGSLLLAIWLGGEVAAHPVWGPALTFTGTRSDAGRLACRGRAAVGCSRRAITCRRSSRSASWRYRHLVMPELRMPALTQFTDGTGPVWKGKLFPFLFITIACGAVSGFHSLIASGTTPKMLANEVHARYIGYGAMLMESFVAIMAMVAASTIDPCTHERLPLSAPMRRPWRKPYRAGASWSRRMC
jgi:carbon starvation protein